jgi:hypothetical protein
MATARPFAYNPGSPIAGTEQIGDLAIGFPDNGFTNDPQFWNGPDEELGYVIVKSIPDGTQPTPISGVTAYIGFNRSEFKTETSFIELANSVFNQSFTTGDGAKTWLNTNGYWTSYGEGNITFVTGIQTYSVLCRMPGDTSNWGLINLNYASNTASVRPLGLSRSDWARKDFYPLNESGYMLVFDNTSGDHKILFLDAAGNTVQAVDIPGTINYNVHQGKIMSVIYEGGIWYFDGLNVYQYTYDATDLNYAEVISDVDSTSSNGTFMFRVVYNNGNAIIKKLYNGTATTIIDYTSVDNYEVKLYDQADYYVIFKISTATNVYQDFKIRKISDNTLLHSVDLTVFNKIDETPMDYKVVDFRNYSINKFAMVIHNWNDSDVDYRIYTYNGTTDDLNSTSHVRGTNYPNFNIIAYTNDRTRTIGTDSVLISFFSSNSGWNGVMNTYAYFDIVYQMSWQTSLTTYVFTNGGVGNETGILFNSDGLTNNYYAICTTNNTDLQVLSITEDDGLEIITLGLLTDFHSPNIDSFGNKSCLISYAASDGSGMILKYFGNTGGIIDELTVTGTTTYNIDTYIGWNIFGVKYDSVLYQINTTTDEIVTIGPWSGNHDDAYTSDNYYEASTSERQGDLVHILYNEFTSDVIILKPTTYVTSTLPSSSEYDLEVGKNGFMYIFEDQNSGNMQINLYDFNLTLLNSIVTDKTNFNFSPRAIKDRFIARHNDDNGNHTWFMITPTFDDSIMVSSSNSSRVENDWVYWDD